MKTIFSNSQRRLPAPKIKMLDAFTVKAAILAGLDLGDDEIISVNFVSSGKILKLNSFFLGHDFSTDVISFNYKNNGFPTAGDVAVELFICPATALEFSTRGGESYPSEMSLYLVHGLLHAAGERDYTEKEILSMRSKERKIMPLLAHQFNFSKIFPECK